MKTTCVGFLICLICLYLIVGWGGGTAITIGGWFFFVGVIVVIIGLLKDWE